MYSPEQALDQLREIIEMVDDMAFQNAKLTDLLKNEILPFLAKSSISPQDISAADTLQLRTRILSVVKED